MKTTELKIGVVYKTLRGFLTYKGKVDGGEIFTVLENKRIDYPNLQLEYPPPGYNRLFILHNNEIKEVPTASNEYGGLEEVI